MVYTHNQFEVSQHQIETAIRLFLDEDDFYCSATLAGAAEEVLGKMLSEKRKVNNSLQSLTAATLRMLSAQEVEALSDGRPLKGYAVLKEEINFYRNWLKHYSEDDFRIEIDAKEAAEELIDRSVTNFFLLSQRESAPMRRFLEYQQSKYAGAST